MDILKFLGVSSGGSLIGILLFVLMLYLLGHLPKKKYSFAARVLMGTGAGTVFGLAVWALSGGAAFGWLGVFDPAAATAPFASDLNPWFSLVAKGYVSLLACLILPMVFLASARLVIHTPEEKAALPWTRWKKWVNTLMVAASALIASCLGLYFRIGAMPGTDTAVFSWASIQSERLTDDIAGLIPSGLGRDLLLFHVVGIFIFGIYVGTAARRMSGKSEKVKSFIDVLDGAFSVGVSVCKTIIAYKPMGAGAIMASLVASHGPAVIVMIVKMLAVLCLGAAAMLALQVLLCTLSGVGPAAFFRAGKPAMVKALKTRSGSACLPEAQQALSETLGLQKEITDEVSAYAISSGMQGCGALFPATAAVFALGLSGMTMTPGLVLTMIVVIALMSYGITELPGTATMAELAAVMGIGASGTLPNLGAMIAIDPIGDVPRTLINVTGCMANAIIVERRVRA